MTPASSAATRTAAVTFVTLGLTYGVWYSYSVFLVALLQEYGWSRSVLAGAFSLFTFVHGIVGSALGLLADRVGPRRVVLGGGCLLVAGLLLDSLVGRPWHLYVAFGLVTSLGVSSSGWIPAVVLIQRWFPQRVGTALGFTSAGIGVGIFLVVPFCQWLVDAVGWRLAFRILAAVVGGWILPATLLLVRDPLDAARAPRPAPAPGPPAAEREPGDAAPAAPGAARVITPRAALRLPAFWLLAGAQLTAAFVNQMLLVHQVAFLVDHGIPALLAASVVGVVGLASVVGKAGGGWVSDRIGRAVTYSIGTTLVVASVGMLGVLALGPGPLPAYAYGALIGVGYSITAPLMPALISDLFRGPHFGVIFGLIHTANAVGGSLGPWVGGRVFDMTGSYAPAFGAGAVAAIASATFVWLASARRNSR